MFNLFNGDNVATFDGRRSNPAGTALTNYLLPPSAFAARRAQVGVRAEY